MAANIALHELQNEKLKIFLFKYTRCNIPVRTTLSNFHTGNIYNQKMEHLKKCWK